MGDLQGDNDLSQTITEKVGKFLDDMGLSLEELNTLKGSPVEPVKAAAYAAKLGNASIVGMAILQSVGVLAEVASLGQVEGIQTAINSILDASGVTSVSRQLWGLPFNAAVIKPAAQYWNKQFMPEIPNPQDLIRFVVREVLTPELFSEYMARQGFSGAWSKAYWEAHWRLPSRDEIIDRVS